MLRCVYPYRTVERMEGVIVARVYLSNGEVLEGTKGNIKRAIKAAKQYYPGIKYRFSKPYCNGDCRKCSHVIRDAQDWIIGCSYWEVEE